MYLLFILALLSCMYIVFFAVFLFRVGYDMIGATSEIVYGMGWDGGYLGV